MEGITMMLGKLTTGLGLVAAIVNYCLFKAVYNFCFHPLAKFPWAAVSYLEAQGREHSGAVRGPQYHRTVFDGPVMLHADVPHGSYKVV